MQRQRRRWNKKDLTELERFVNSRKRILLNNFYSNILAGDLIYRKNSRFFFDMGKKISKGAEKCKSKFQKYEKVIYCKFLEIPEDHYQVFLYLRQKKKARNLKNRILLPSKNSQMKNQGKLDYDLDTKLITFTIYIKTV